MRTFLMLALLCLPVAHAEQELWQLIWQQTTNKDALQERLQQTQRQVGRLQNNLDLLQQHLDALAGSQQIFLVLRQQQQQLPQPEFQLSLADEIAEVRMLQFRLNQFLLNSDLTTPDRRRWEREQDQLQQLLQLQLDLQAQQQQLLVNSAALQQQLEDRLFWLPSNASMSGAWWRLWPLAGQQQWQNQWQPEQWLRLPRPGLLTGLAVLALMSLAALAQGCRTGLWRRLQDINQHTQSQLAQAAPSTRQSPIPYQGVTAIVIAAVLVSPPSLLLTALGLYWQPATGISLGSSLLAAALSLFVWRWFRLIIGRSGIAEHHLAWPPTIRQDFLRFLTPFGWLLVITSPILALAAQQANIGADVTGPLVLLVSCSWIAWLFARLLRRLPNVYGSQLLQWLLGALLVMLPMLLVILTLQGYYFTSLQLTGRLLATLYLLVIWVLVQSLVNRSLTLSSQRLTRERQALEEDYAAQLALLANQDSEMPSTLTPLPKLAVSQITAQSKRLANFAILVLFSLLAYSVWGDLLSALGQINQWVLFSTGQDSAIRLGDLVSAVALLGLTFFLAANLPGLLEVVLLSRLQLQQGTSYAITSLLNYGITSLGVLLMLSSLGVSWDKLQWLVAALTVGLGFGLQEIFANFVSGLIILFERPIRIGDVVTVGNLSGKVSQIRIRATTITDFDRKEIIVPNKTFITGQLVNWSLSDTVTRVVVKIGVAYGSDLRRVKEILLRGADLNERVLKDPEPQVLFLNFGESTLDHELRIHVNGLGDRNPAIDEINRYIDQQFKRAGIDIAFRQLDVHVHQVSGLASTAAEPPKPPAAMP